MTAAAPPLPNPSPLDVIDLAAFEQLLTDAGAALGAATPVALAEAAPLAIGLGGVWVTNTLLKWPAWDHFWLNVGATLNNVWHSAAGFLFGSSAAVDAHTVGLMINLSTHVAIRGTRQLVGSLASKTMSSIQLLTHAMRSVATTLHNHATAITHNYAAAIAYAESWGQRAESYADARVQALASSIPHLVAQSVSGLRAEIARELVAPLHAEVVAIGQIAGVAIDDAHSVAATLHDHVLPNLAKATATAGIAATLAHAITTWVDDCGEPMCQYAGPKTDWGKLLKRFAEADIFALLAAVAAENPHTLERIAEDLAGVLEPLVRQWVYGWFGVAGGDQSGAAKGISGVVGKLPF